MVATQRAIEREGKRENERERALCRPPFCTCVRAAFPTHSGNILLTLSEHNFHTQNLLTCPRGGAQRGGGAGRVGLVSVTWHCVPSLSLSLSFFEYPKKHTEPTRRLPPPYCAAPRGALSGLSPFRKGSRCPQSVYMSVRVHACVCLCVHVCVS